MGGVMLIEENIDRSTGLLKVRLTYVFSEISVLPSAGESERTLKKGSGSMFRENGGTSELPFISFASDEIRMVPVCATRHREIAPLVSESTGVNVNKSPPTVRTLFVSITIDPLDACLLRPRRNQDLFIILLNRIFTVPWK